MKKIAICFLFLFTISLLPINAAMSNRPHRHGHKRPQSVEATLGVSALGLLGIGAAAYSVSRKKKKK
jgi:uncharacterized membrane protein